MGLTGLLLGAGASYEIGMPLAFELTKELKNWLTPTKLRWLNDVWQERGGGYSDPTIDDVASILTMDGLNYEHIMGYLEVQSERERGRSQEYHGLLGFLSEIVYALLKERHVLNGPLIERRIRYLDGIKRFVEENKPLWVLSLNHDLLMECFSAHAGIRVKYGFSDELVRLPRRDLDGTKVGDLQAHVTRRDQFAKHALSFLPTGEEGINLLKIHGSLDEFAFNDGHDVLKIAPVEKSVRGVLTGLRNANDEVRYIDPRWPGGVVKSPNEIVYADAEGVMQFLRRTPLAGVFKFQNRSSQNVPNEMLSCFTHSLAYLSTLVCIGYAFGDLHVILAIRNWLELSGERQLTIVDPNIKRVPTMLIHLSPQIDLAALQATDYLDGVAGILRPRREVIERQFGDLLRDKNRSERDSMIREYMDQFTDGVGQRTVEWFKTLPWRDGSIDLEALDLTMEEFLEISRERVPIPSPEDALEEFLRQATKSE